MKPLFIALLCLYGQTVMAQQFLSATSRTSDVVRLSHLGPPPAGFTTDPANGGFPQATLAQTDSVPRVVSVRIIGMGSANDITSARGLGGNLALGAYMKVQKSMFNKWYSRHAFYALFNARAGNTSDTSVVARTFLFPDIGKRDFTLGYEMLIYKEEASPFRFIPFCEFSWSRNVFTKADTTNSFHSLNFLLGAKLSLSTTFKVGNDVEKPFNFIFYPYYQLITVDPKDFALRNEMLREYNLPPTFHTLGFYASLQVAELALFANYKQILNGTDGINNRDLKGGTLVIGALIATEIFKL